MTPKLILVEGLPGSGKSTTAQLVYDIITEMNIMTNANNIIELNMEPQLFLEGNLEHPADYDRVACFTKGEFDDFLSTHEQYIALLSNRWIEEDSHYFLEYGKLQNELGASLPDELLHAIGKNDIYELPLDQNRKWITNRWRKFAERAVNGSDIFVFECCFIQNPVTMGMIKYGAEKKEVASYVNELAAIVEPLNPLLIYVDQSDLDHSFKKAVKERPQQWSEGFIGYYTSQGYGRQKGCTGLEGTLQVLQARRQLEEEIVSGLKIGTIKVDNSSYDMSEYKRVLERELAVYFK